ncbi:MAG: hypothetical protein WD382_02635 [Halofilum sp. (in: g-proteobacteria)]
MKAFAAFVMRGPTQAGSIAGASLLAGLVVPPFAWFSGAVVALVLLRLGAAALARMALPALALVLVVGTVVWQQPSAVAVASVGAWLPVVVVAGVLRARARLDDALLVACVLGFLAVVAIHGLLADPAATWREVLLQVFPPEQLAANAGIEASAAAEVIDRMAPLMTGLVAASAVFSAITGVLLARWWQSLLDHEGAFAREFQSLRLGRVAALVAGAVCLAAALMQSATLLGLALVTITLYLIQGLAVVHGVVSARGMTRGWLIGLYVLGILLTPQVVVGLALVGVADAWGDFRRIAAGEA